MEQKSLTALISAFSRAYHALNNEVTIFNDSLARDLLTDEEFNQIAKNMSNGIGFFNPSFVGEPEQALRWVVDNQLSPSPLGRAAFAEKSLEWAVRTGTEQYLSWGAGYVTFASRQPSEPVFLYFRKYSVHIVVTVPFCYQNPDRQTCHRPVPELVPPHQTFL